MPVPVVPSEPVATTDPDSPWAVPLPTIRPGSSDFVALTAMSAGVK